MKLYAYRVIAEIDPSVDMDSLDFSNGLENMRNGARTRVKQMGGDPLESEQVILRGSKDNHTVRMIWRSNIIVPEDGRLVQNIRDQAQQANTIVSWRLEYHVCGNGKNIPCEPWKTIIQEESV